MEQILTEFSGLLRYIFLHDSGYPEYKVDRWLWGMGAVFASFCAWLAFIQIRLYVFKIPSRWHKREALERLGIAPRQSEDGEGARDHTPVMDQLGLTPHLCCEGVLITGQIGSGKTSLLKRVEFEMARTGCGILHMAVKPDEPESARRILTKAGRWFKEFTPGVSKWNGLSEELARPGGSPESMAQLLEITNEIMHPAATGQEEAFWATARTEAATHAISAVWMAYGREATFDRVYDFVVSAPPTLEALASSEFARSNCAETLELAMKNKVSPSDDRRIAEAINYYTKTLPGAGEKVYGSTALALAGQLAPFVRGDMWDTTTTSVSNISPSDPCRGECVIMNCPAIISPAYQQIQILFGLMSAQATLRRLITPSTPITAIFQDEAQYVISMKEQAKYQTISRSQKLASFVAVQNLPVLYETVSQPTRAKTQCRALTGNLVTKIFMANTDHETMEHFSELTGKQFRNLSGGSMQQQKEQGVFGVGDGVNVSWHQSLMPQKLGSALTRLRTGGSSNGFVVEGYVVASNRKFNGQTYKRVAIAQDLTI